MKRALQREMLRAIETEGLTQITLARGTGLSSDTINRAFRTGGINLQTLDTLATGLGLKARVVFEKR